MFKISRRFLLTSLMLLIMILLWSEFDKIYYNGGNSSFEQLLPRESIVIPENISESLEMIKKNAVELNNSRTFNFASFKLAGENYITYNTPLVIQTYYERSNKLIQDIIQMPESFVGLTLSEFKNISSPWEIKDFSVGKWMILYRALDEISPEEKNSMHLGVKDGRVAIFYGEKGENLKNITDIEVEELPFQEQNNLKQGIIIYSDEELLAVLDGFISRINKD